MDVQNGIPLISLVMLLTKFSTLLAFTLLASTQAAYLQKRDQTVTFDGRSFINRGLVGFVSLSDPCICKESMSDAESSGSLQC